MSPSFCDAHIAHIHANANRYDGFPLDCCNLQYAFDDSGYDATCGKQT